MINIKISTDNNTKRKQPKNGPVDTLKNYSSIAWKAKAIKPEQATRELNHIITSICY